MCVYVCLHLHTDPQKYALKKSYVWLDHFPNENTGYYFSLYL